MPRFSKVHPKTMLSLQVREGKEITNLSGFQSMKFRIRYRLDLKIAYLPQPVAVSSSENSAPFFFNSKYVLSTFSGLLAGKTWPVLSSLRIVISPHWSQIPVRPPGWSCSHDSHRSQRCNKGAWEPFGLTKTVCPSVPTISKPNLSRHHTADFFAS